MTDKKLTGLELLRAPFAPNHISKLPKPTKQQTEEVKNDYKKGIRCEECGAWHHPNVVHLDYVGHAALTDRLLDADPMWYWEPVAFNEQGLPAFDGTGGLWIRLYVCGVSRLGYGHAAGKPNSDPGSREKEVIGDALRNAAMRFGAALDLWHKGDLHADEEEKPEAKKPENPFDDPPPASAEWSESDLMMLDAIAACKTPEQLGEWSKKHGPAAEMSDNVKRLRRAYRERMAEINEPKTMNPLGSG